MKQNFITLKKECRTALGELPKKKAAAREADLADLQKQFRDLDAEFKAMKEEDTKANEAQDRAELFGDDGGERKRGGDFDPTKADNNSLLTKAAADAKKTTAKLRDIIVDVHQAREVWPGVWGGEAPFPRVVMRLRVRF